MSDYHFPSKSITGRFPTESAWRWRTHLTNWSPAGQLLLSWLWKCCSRFMFQWHASSYQDADVSSSLTNRSLTRWWSRWRRKQTWRYAVHAPRNVSFWTLTLVCRAICTPTGYAMMSGLSSWRNPHSKWTATRWYKPPGSRLLLAKMEMPLTQGRSERV